MIVKHRLVSPPYIHEHGHERAKKNAQPTPVGESRCQHHPAANDDEVHDEQVDRVQGDAAAELIEYFAEDDGELHVRKNPRNKHSALGC